jgi:hypothetical protein
MAFHAEFIERRRVIHADFLLLRVVTHAHADVVVATQTPDVERHLESANSGMEHT